MPLAADACCCPSDAQSLSLSNRFSTKKNALNNLIFWSFFSKIRHHNPFSPRFFGESVWLIAVHTVLAILKKKANCLQKTIPDLVTSLFQTVRQMMSNKSDQSLHTNHLLNTCQSMGEGVVLLGFTNISYLRWSVKWHGSHLSSLTKHPNECRAKTLSSHQFSLAFSATTRLWVHFEVG